MGSMHLIVFFFLGIIHFSLSKECSRCSKTVDTEDPDNLQYLIQKLKNETLKDIKGNEEVELVQIKEIDKKAVEGYIYSYDFVVRGAKTKSLYDCKLVMFLQECLGVEIILEYCCRPVSSIVQERISIEEKFLTGNNTNLADENVGLSRKLKYKLCVAKAAVRCLLP